MSEKQRVFFVIDMKTFFASVECAERGLDPFETNLVVADESRGEGGICLAVSPKMKAQGVKNRCRLFEIPKNIKYIIAKPRMRKYIEYTAEIYGIYLKYIDKNDIHVYSIDECFIDATDYLKMYKIRAKAFAQKLMGEIKDKLHIPSTAGIGSNMYLAKIALDITAKHSPDFIGWLTEEKYRQNLWKHTPITDFWGISTGTASRLARHNIFTMQDLAHANEDMLYKEFGINAELLIDHAWGKESCTIKDIKNYKTKKKSISNMQILPKNYNFEDAKLVMKEMIQSGCYRLYRDGYVTQLLHLYIGYGDKNKEIVKGSRRMSEMTNLYSFIEKVAEDLFDDIASRDRPIRRIGFDFADLRSSEHESYDFFTSVEKVKKEKKLVESVLKLQDKYGKNAVLRGMDLQENATLRERNKLIGGHNSGES